ncbi:MAG: hypothetical protein E2O29_03600, partial [Deltaproteobacteria bacterium]
MSKSLLSLFVAVLLVVGFAVVNTMAAPGEKGVFESPQVSNGGVEVDGSEGKIERDGDYKIEIEPITPNLTVQICIFDINLGIVFLQDTASDADGELKVVSNLNTDAP